MADVDTETEYERLRYDFTVSVVVIGIVLLLVLVLSVILYCWMYTLEKKFKQQKDPENNIVDFRIKRAQIREDLPTSMTKPLSVSQNPLAKSGHFEAVVDDLKKTSNGPSSTQTKYPNYLADNNNFNY